MSTGAFARDLKNGKVISMPIPEEKNTGPDPGPPIRRRTDKAIPGSLFVLVVLAFLVMCYFASSVFITIISSILIAFALEPVVHLLCRKARLGRTSSSVIVVFLAMAVLYAIFYMAYASARQLFKDLPLLIEQIRNSPLVERITSMVIGVTETLQEAGRSIAPQAPAASPKETAIILRDSNAWTETLFRGLGSLKTILFSLSFIPFLVYFLLAEKEGLIRRTRILFPEEHQETVQATIYGIERMLQKFITGNAIVAGILSIFTALAFLLVGLPYWLVLGIASGVVSTIPYLGLILALFPPLVVGLVTFESGVPIAIIVACVSGLHILAANFLIPKLVGKGVQLNPVAATISIMFFGWLWGGMGLILGIPIVAVAKSVLENMQPTRKLGQWLGD
jgi:predicted PurR-regulated permease PerM